MNCTLTRHAKVRCRQRGFRESDVDLAMALGVEVKSGFLVRRKDADEIITRLRRLIQTLERLKDTSVVADGDRVITVYKARSRRRGR